MHRLCVSSAMCVQDAAGVNAAAKTRTNWLLHAYVYVGIWDKNLAQNSVDHSRSPSSAWKQRRVRIGGQRIRDSVDEDSYIRERQGAAHPPQLFLISKCASFVCHTGSLSTGRCVTFNGVPFSVTYVPGTGGCGQAASSNYHLVLPSRGKGNR